MAKMTRRDQVKKAQKKTVKAAGKVARSNRVQVTLGDLIAAAFDTVGGEAKKVARVISSPTMTVATGTHIVFVG